MFKAPEMPPACNGNNLQSSEDQNQLEGVLVGM